MERYKIIESTSNDSDRADVMLHENILEILFKHKEEIYKKLTDLRGTFLIDHIAITILDPDNKIVIFSITPSVEYNLIVQGLWKYDHGFFPHFQKNNPFYMWEKAYSEKYFDEIKNIKEFKHGFTFGFNISKKLSSFTLIYSYATRSKNDGLYEYYYSHVNELSELGDYGYKLIYGIYEKYCNPRFKLPPVTLKQHYFVKPFLKLIVNNP